MELSVNQSISLALALKQVNTQAEFHTAVFKKAVEAMATEAETMTELIDTQSVENLIDILV